MWETWVWCPSWEDRLEEGMATHSNILAWRIPMTEEPGGLQSMGSQRVRHNWATKHSTAQECSPATQDDRQGAPQLSRLASLKVLQWPTRGSLCFSTCSWCLRPPWNPACPSRAPVFLLSAPELFGCFTLLGPVSLGASTSWNTANHSKNGNMEEPF